MRRIVVLGLGNVLMSDEGIGVHLASKLKSMVGDGIEVYDSGTNLFEAVVRNLKSADKNVTLVMLDAVNVTGMPGRLHFFEFDELKKAVKRNGTFLSQHDFDLFKEVMDLELLGYRFDRIVVVGIEPKEVKFSRELSDELKGRLSEIAIEVKKFLEDMLYDRNEA